MSTLDDLLGVVAGQIRRPRQPRKRKESVAVKYEYDEYDDRCPDCGTLVTPTHTPRGTHNWHWYIVYPDVWAAAGLRPIHFTLSFVESFLSVNDRLRRSDAFGRSEPLELGLIEATIRCRLSRQLAAHFAKTIEVELDRVVAAARAANRPPNRPRRTSARPGSPSKSARSQAGPILTCSSAI